jgi:hypothetical protein
MSAIAHGGEDPIVVVEVADPLDQRAIDYVVAALQADDVHAFILKIDSPGVSSGDLAEMYDAVLEANAPVIAWIGPNPAVAYGGAAFDRRPLERASDTSARLFNAQAKSRPPCVSAMTLRRSLQQCCCLPMQR